MISDGSSDFFDNAKAKAIAERPIPISSEIYEMHQRIKKAKLNDEVAYKFKTSQGTMSIKPSDIMEALEEQAKLDEVDFQPPEEDLQGWSIMYACDEAGNSRPLLLMRILPGPSKSIPYYKMEKDDEKMGDIIMRHVYKLSPAKIKWIRFRMKMVYHFNKFKEAFQTWANTH
jgi:hypothetical protein